MTELAVALPSWSGTSGLESEAVSIPTVTGMSERPSDQDHSIVSWDCVILRSVRALFVCIFVRKNTSSDDVDARTHTRRSPSSRC